MAGHRGRDRDLVVLPQQRIKVLAFADRIAVAVPIGLLLGRVANFINGELWGRPVAG